MQTQIFLRQENGQKQAYKQTVRQTANAATRKVLPTIQHSVHICSNIFSEEAYYTVRFITVAYYQFSDESLMFDKCTKRRMHIHCL